MTFEAYIEKRSTAYNEASAGIQEISDLPIGKYQGEIYETKLPNPRKTMNGTYGLESRFWDLLT